MLCQRYIAGQRCSAPAAFKLRWPENQLRAYCAAHTIEALEAPEAPRVRVSVERAGRNGLRLVGGEA